MIGATPDIEVNFERDLLSIMRASLTYWGVSRPADGTFESTAIAFFNASRRLIPARPRRVHEASMLHIPTEHLAQYEALKEKFQRGGDVRLHMSKTIDEGGYKDALYNDWGIQHFHFRERPDRTGDLVYAIVDWDDVYVVAIKGHSSFAERELLEIVYREWPQRLEGFRCRGVLRTEHGPRSDDDIRILRQAGISVLHDLGNGVVLFSPGGGYASDRTSTQAVRALQATRRRIKQYEEMLRADVSGIRASIVGAGRTPPERWHLRLLIRDGIAYAFDPFSRIAQQLGPSFE